MIILHDPQCTEYGSPHRPERPGRIVKSAAHLRGAHPTWEWRIPAIATEDMLLTVHTPALLKRLQVATDFDEDTPYFDNIYDHARRSVGAALCAMHLAFVQHEKAFALMRPPGHHATAGQAMGFCYLNQIAIAAVAARARGAQRVAVWDFDAHHGNGTEAILDGRDGFLFSSVHQFPGYPGTGTRNSSNCRNYPVAPHTPRAAHMAELARSWDAILGYKPDLVLVSAGFDAYVNDPITAMTLEIEDFGELGRWVHQADFPAAAILEGGYSAELPLLIDAFLNAWVGA
jgi:acetoin utilization deacetylase AcuC-like enzyme